jgi:membrane-bound lytic murein transglycosylase B
MEARVRIMLVVALLACSAAPAAGADSAGSGPATVELPAVSARPPATPPADGLEAFLAGIRTEARARGISQATIDASLVGIVDRPQVIEADRSQPKSPSDFCRYLSKRLTPTRIERGKRMLDEHRDLLADITRAYGVPARYVVALWGLETNFGDYQGDHPIFDTLVTLARDPRRGDFFRDQIFAGLRMVEDGHHPAEGFVGSWAGATGQVQFMPSTYLAYAVDQDGDGHRDLWRSVPDALASAAHLLSRSGWRSGETWGRQVVLPSEIHGRARALGRGSRSLEGWSALGVRRHDGAPLPDANLLARLVLPQRRADPAFLVYGNYSVFMDWNRSTFFAISVGALADEIDDRSTLVACRG